MHAHRRHHGPLSAGTARSLATLGALGALALPAQAAWLGLDDGLYAVDLNCTSSSEFACPTTILGTLTIAGGGATHMDFTVDGLDFSGDPNDGLFEGSSVDFENSALVLAPTTAYSFLSLRYVTAGSFGSYGIGDRFWIYCSNNTATTCFPATQGSWSARLIDGAAVPAPPTLALGAVALGLLAATARRQGPPPRDQR